VTIFDDLLRDLASTLSREPAGTAGELRGAYARACRQIDDNPAEQQRIGDIAALLDAEDILYAQAHAAAGRGDTGTAIALLRTCAEAGAGEAAWLLAQLLEETGDPAEATTWYQRARDDGDDRAEEKLAALRARPCPHATPGGQDPPGIFTSHSAELPAWHARVLRPADAAGLAGQAAGIWGSGQVLTGWCLLDAADPGPGRGLPADIAPVMIISSPGSDHRSSLTGIWRELAETRNHEAHGTTRFSYRVRINWPESARAWDTSLAGWELTLMWFYPEAGNSRAAAWALPWRLDDGYGRPCPANLDRYAGAAGAWHPRWHAREPVVADVMLPPSEVPACTPGTTVAQALELLVQSGTQALPVCEMTRVTGIVTLADLARHISAHQGVPPVTGTIRALMRPAATVPPGTPLPAIARAIADDGIIIVSASGDQPDGYLTAESLLTQAPPGTSTRPDSPGRPPLLIPGPGAVLLNRSR
jgi:CBS domain-containing protein